MHHSSQNHSRLDHQILGSLHICMSSRPRDVASKKLGNARATLTMLCALESSPTSIITPSSKLKKIYHASLIAANKLQPKRLWQTVNTILHRKPSTILPSSPPTSSLADKFASFFTDKITKLHSSLSSTADSTSPHIEPPSVPSILASFRLAKVDDIPRLINQ